MCQVLGKRYLRLYGLLGWWVLVVLTGLTTACAETLEDERGRVLVVQNQSSSASRAIAGYYLKRRSIDPTHLVSIQVPDSATSQNAETIPYERFRTAIEGPIRRALIGRVDQIRYIVLTKGVPIRVTEVPRQAANLTGYHQTQSVDSTLAALDYRGPSFVVRNGASIAAVFTPNLYWQQPGPFEHRDFGGYLVTRLDGYSEADARALVDRSLGVGILSGRVLIDPRGDNAAGPRPQPVSLIKSETCRPPTCAFNPDYTSVGNEDYNRDQLSSAALSRSFQGLTVEVTPPDRFGSGTDLLAYSSWGSNDPAFDPLVYSSLRFLPGAIAETAVSTSARTFLPTQGGQSLIADLIHQGVTGVKGYTDEPYLDAVASPSVLLTSYLCGNNLAVSYYRASRDINWRDIVIGDPLARLHGPVSKTCRDL